MAVLGFAVVLVRNPLAACPLVAESWVDGHRINRCRGESDQASMSRPQGCAARTPQTGKVVIDLLLETQPPFNPDDITTLYAGALSAYAITRVTGDARLLRLRMAQTVPLPADKRLVAPLVPLERQTSRVGREIFRPPNGQDDVAHAAAAAAVLADRRGTVAFEGMAEQLVKEQGSVALQEPQA